MCTHVNSSKAVIFLDLIIKNIKKNFKIRMDEFFLMFTDTSPGNCSPGSNSSARVITPSYSKWAQCHSSRLYRLHSFWSQIIPILSHKSGAEEIPVIGIKMFMHLKSYLMQRNYTLYNLPKKKHNRKHIHQYKNMMLGLILAISYTKNLLCKMLFLLNDMQQGGAV